MSLAALLVAFALHSDATGPASFVAEAKLLAPDASPAVKEALAQIASIAWDPSRGCLPPAEADIDAQSARMAQFPDLPRFLEPQSVIVTGRVETLTPGWDITTRRPATLATIRVIDSLRGAARDRSLTFEIDAGRIAVGGRTLCTEPHYRMPKSGDLLLVAGRRDVDRPAHLITSYSSIFAIEDDTVVVPAWLNLAGSHRVPLDLLRSKLNERTHEK